jgi:predicted MFS family arabinose efflux permease
MGLYMLVFVGGTPIGAPIVGAVTSHYGARDGMLLCGVIPVLAALVTAAAIYGRRRRARLAGLASLAETGPLPMLAGRA